MTVKYLVPIFLLTLSLSCSTAPKKVPVTKEPESITDSAAGVAGPSILRAINIKEKSQGTSFVVRGASGKLYAVTNAHVCVKAEANIFLATDLNPIGMTRPVLIDRANDLCLMPAGNTVSPLEIESKPFSTTPSYVMGHPVGRALERADLTSPSWQGAYFCPYVLSCGTAYGEIEPGSSGSPVLNDQKMVVGIVYGRGNHKDRSVVLFIPAAALKRHLEIL